MISWVFLVVKERTDTEVTLGVPKYRIGIGGLLAGGWSTLVAILGIELD